MNIFIYFSFSLQPKIWAHRALDPWGPKFKSMGQKLYFWANLTLKCYTVGSMGILNTWTCQLNLGIGKVVMVEWIYDKFKGKNSPLQNKTYLQVIDRGENVWVVNSIRKLSSYLLRPSLNIPMKGDTRACPHHFSIHIIHWC